LILIVVVSPVVRQRSMNRRWWSFSGSQQARLSLQPLADNTGAPLAIARPCFRKYVVSDVVALDVERVLNDLGSAIAIATVDRLFD
jgi:hypothetical protein